MRITAQAPCRVDMAGGTVDIWPLYLFHAGAVTVNFAVNRYTRCTLETHDSPAIILRSLDLKAEEKFDSVDELKHAGKDTLPLLAFLVDYFEPKQGFVMETNAGAPAGAGISGSSSL